MKRIVPRVAIIGPIQAALPKGTFHSQRYRSEIASMVKLAIGDFEYYDPAERVQQLLAEVGSDFFDQSSVTQIDREIVSRFHSEFLLATAEVGKCDLVVCYLPARTLSMGTAMELYSAKLGGCYVISVTELSDNLAVTSTSDVMVNDLECLGSELRKWKVQSFGSSD